MSGFEISPWDFDEYIAGEAKPIMEEDLCVGSLYTFIALFDDDVPRQSPSEINDVDFYDEKRGIYVVDFSILSADNLPQTTTRSLFLGGLYQRQLAPAGVLGIGMDDRPIAKVVRGYFKLPVHIPERLTEEYVETGLEKLSRYANELASS